MREGTTEVKGAVSMVIESPTAPEVVTMMGEFSAISLGERPLHREETKAGRGKGVRMGGWMDGEEEGREGREGERSRCSFLFESKGKSPSSSTRERRLWSIEPQAYRTD